VVVDINYMMAITGMDKDVQHSLTLDDQNCKICLHHTLINWFFNLSIFYKLNNNNMIRFNRSTSLIANFFGGAKVDPSLIINTKYDSTNDLRDKIHLPEAL